MIYTSSFHTISLFPGWYEPVAISRTVPYGYTGKRYMKLVPPKDLLDDYKCKRIDEDQYTKLYKERVLSNLDPYEVYHELVILTGSTNIVLLCYENSYEF